DAAAVRLGLDAADVRRRNLVRSDEMPWDCGTVSFGVKTVYDSGDFPALFETARVEARPDGRFTVDTGASSMGPGLETALAQILGSALGLPADRFVVRHPDTAAIESGVGTYGSRGTVTAGNAA